MTKVNKTDLWREEEDSFLLPSFCPLGHIDRPRHFHGVLLWYSHYVEARLNLLPYQGFRRSHEHYLPLRIPPVEVVHHHRSYQCLAQTLKH